MYRRKYVLGSFLEICGSVPSLVCRSTSLFANTRSMKITGRCPHYGVICTQSGVCQKPAGVSPFGCCAVPAQIRRPSRHKPHQHSQIVSVKSDGFDTIHPPPSGLTCQAAQLQSVRASNCEQAPNNDNPDGSTFARGQAPPTIINKGTQY